MVRSSVFKFKTVYDGMNCITHFLFHSNASKERRCSGANRKGEQTNKKELSSKYTDEYRDANCVHIIRSILLVVSLSFISVLTFLCVLRHNVEKSAKKNK